MLKKSKVLLIEDSQDFAEATSFQLEHAGYEVCVAGTGPEGLEKADSEVPDLIILDLKLPQMNGFEVLGKLRCNAKTARIPVIMLTAMRDAKFILEAESAGVNDYVIKSDDMDELVNLVGKHIALSKAKQEMA